jgi:signal transduction histidine kinase
MGNPAAPAEDESRQLVSDLFHQLSQPLTTLCCSLELTLLQNSTPEQYSELVNRALDQAERVSWLATALRELFDAGQPGPDLEVLELRRVVQDAVSDLLPVAESAGVEVRYLLRSACWVWFDAQRLRQGLFHLLGSAVAWGGRDAVLQIELEEGGNEAVLGLTVSGHGAGNGLSPANSDQELLQRLGLGIARAIFEAARCKFWVECEAQQMSVQVRVARSGSR